MNNFIACFYYRDYQRNSTCNGNRAYESYQLSWPFQWCLVTIATNNLNTPKALLSLDKPIGHIIHSAIHGINHYLAEKYLAGKTNFPIHWREIYQQHYSTYKHLGQPHYACMQPYKDNQGCHGQGKVREKRKFLKVREKSGKFLKIRENLWYCQSQWKVREFCFPV